MTPDDTHIPSQAEKDARKETLDREIQRLERLAARRSPVLVADDMQTMRLLLTQAMRAAGFEEIYRAPDGEAAMDLLERYNCDLALVDWNMPRCDGMHLLTRVRAHPTLADVVFIMVTAENVDTRVIRAAEESQDAYLTKPVSADRLVRRLQTILERRLVTAKALRLEADDQVDLAMDEFVMAMRNQPRARWPYLALGGLLMRAGRLEESEDCYQRALQLDPDALAAQVALGRIAELRGDSVKARDLFESARRSNPLFVGAHDALADSLQQDGLLEQAADVLQEAVRLSGSRNAQRHERLGRINYSIGRFAEAEDCFAKARDLAPTADVAADWLRLARTRLAQGHYHPAVEALQHAAESEVVAERLEALLIQAETHLHFGLLAEGGAVYEIVLRPATWPGGELPFDIHHLHREMGGAYLRQGYEQQAVSLLALSLAASPGDAENIALMRAICEQAGKPEMLRRAAEAVEEIRQREVEACSQRGLQFIQQGQMEKALAEYSHGLRLDPGAGRLHYNIAKLHMRAGRNEDASRSLGQAAERGLKRGDWELVEEAAKILARLGEKDQALQLARELQRQQPQRPAAARIIATLNAPGKPAA